MTKEEFNLGQQLAAKDSEIGLLRADKYTDQKIIEAYEKLQAQINALKESQYAVNLQQATLNATQTATITCMQQQIAQLQSLTKLVVPNTRLPWLGQRDYHSCGCRHHGRMTKAF